MAKTIKRPPKAKKVEFSLVAPGAKTAFIAGSFNQWNRSSHPLKKDKQGIWKMSIPLELGEYEYRFFVDGEWQNDPKCSSFIENPFGTVNCVKIVE
jgi:1,4-alpha-glucan branching enzyme